MCVSVEAPTHLATFTIRAKLQIGDRRYEGVESSRSQWRDSVKDWRKNGGQREVPTETCVSVCVCACWYAALERRASWSLENIGILLMAALYSSPRPQSAPPGAPRQRAEWSRGCAQ